ncbi:hypothetical protein RV420_440009 [Roseovarius sp. EC-SD190]|nr:hypothetical protein RV420_440009 [Roseovarius sp. EC-SD190]
MIGGVYTPDLHDNLHVNLHDAGI